MSGPGESVPGSRALSWLALAAVAALFAYNVDRYFFLGDDSFISFRYAKHLVDGQGLVWNPGERVEGYTNFLWVLLMAASLAVGLAPELTSNALGIASGAGILAALLVFSARLTSWRNPFIWVAPLALASSRSFTAWCSGGLETAFFSFLVLLATLSFLSEGRRNAARPFGSSILFALATLTRPEGGLVVLVCGGFFAADIATRRRSLRSGLAWSLPYGVVVGSHLLWRQAYYGFWLPNTFYAKVPGTWWEQGARYLGLFAEDYRILWFLPLLLISLVRRGRVAHVFGALVGAHLFYVAMIGGDRFEFRFLVVILPFLYWLLGDGLHQLHRTVQGARGPLAASALSVGLALLLLVATHLGSVSASAMSMRHGVNSIQNIRAYAEQRVAEGRFLRGLVDRGALPDDLLIAVTGAGALPYYTDWPTVDMHGLNDVKIARMPLDARGVVAHERIAPFEYLSERGVVMVDLLNRIVHSSDVRSGIGFESQPLRLQAVKAGGRYLIFATLVKDRELERIFRDLKLLD